MKKEDIAMEMEQQQATLGRTLSLPTAVLDCYACRQPLEPSISKCDADHPVCPAPACRELHYSNCRRLVAHSKLFDTLALLAKVPCDYESFGCNSRERGGIVYYKAADHRRSCPHAPCGCPERGCGFLRPLQELLEHVSGRDGHSRLTINIRYGQQQKVTLPLSPLWYVLVGQEDEAVGAGADRHRDVFLVSFSDRNMTKMVSLVCVRADVGAPGEVQFSGTLAVEDPDDGTRMNIEFPRITSSCLSGDPPVPREVKVLPVLEEYLTGDSVTLIIQINRLQTPAPTLPPSSHSQAAATSPPCPTAAIKLAGTKQSSKKRKATNPRNSISDPFSPKTPNLSFGAKNEF